MPAAAYIFLAVAIAIFAATVGGVLLVVRARSLPGPSLVGRTVVVNTKRPDDLAVRGVLVAQHGDRLVLREAVFIESPKASVEAAGLVHIPLAAVSTVQEILPVAEPASLPVVLDR